MNEQLTIEFEKKFHFPININGEFGGNGGDTSGRVFPHMKGQMKIQKRVKRKRESRAEQAERKGQILKVR